MEPKKRHDTARRAAWAYSRARGIDIDGPRPADLDMASAILGADSARAAADLYKAADALRLEAAADGNPGRADRTRRVFELVAEAARRELGLTPFDTQVLAALALDGGRAVQMETGEGKTLAAVFPAAAEVLRGGHVHVLTANDYLAGRDAAWMGPVYRALGVSVAAVLPAMLPDQRRAAYAADVVYLTVREAGFDFLRDGLARSRAEKVQRGFGFAIVDEADAIMVDEARSPLVIAGIYPSDGVDVRAMDRFAAGLAVGPDVGVDEAGGRVFLTLEGQEKAARRFGLAGVHDIEASPWYARLHAALRARHLLSRDVDYVVKDSAVVMIDGYTGRAVPGRLWPWGVQAALEAREGLAAGREGRVLGSITVRDYLLLYPRLAAMTATAVACAEELSDAYGLGVTVIPSHVPSARVDEPDRVYARREAMTAAVVDDVAAAHAAGRPVLVGTSSVAESEELAGLLRARGVACAVLNARDDDAEARIVAEAGTVGAVTVATGMAGRGTDIRLGGESRDRFDELEAMGGLLVVGVGRRESRRLDDQLRGRAGRQGEPGTTRFYASLEDELFVRYGAISLLPKALRRVAWQAAGVGVSSAGVAGLPVAGALVPDGPIADARVAREMARAQAILETRRFKARKSLFEYTRFVELDRRYARQVRDRALDAGAPEALLAAMDEFWAAHLAALDDLKEGIALRRYAGLNPVGEFERAAAAMFEEGMARFEPPEDRDYAERPDDLSAEPPADVWTYVAEDEALQSFAMPVGFTGPVGSLLSLPVGLTRFLERLMGRGGR